jgi:hypothetical protein
MLKHPRRRRQLISNVKFSKDSIALGLSIGRALIELRECDPALHHWIEELIADGKAVASQWQHQPETGEVYRTITQRPLQPDERVKKDGHF